jgi:hypothetical protein
VVKEVIAKNGGYSYDVDFIRTGPNGESLSNLGRVVMSESSLNEIAKPNFVVGDQGEAAIRPAR